MCRGGHTDLFAAAMEEKSYDGEEARAREGAKGEKSQRDGYAEVEEHVKLHGLARFF